MAENSSRQTLVDKIWRRHEMTQVEGERLLYVDYLMLHEGARHAFDDLEEMGRQVWRPQRVIACADHYVPTRDRKLGVAGVRDPAVRGRCWSVSTATRAPMRCGISASTIPSKASCMWWRRSSASRSPAYSLPGRIRTPPRTEPSGAWPSASERPMRSMCWRRKPYGAASRASCASSSTAHCIRMFRPRT